MDDHTEDAYGKGENLNEKLRILRVMEVEELHKRTVENSSSMANHTVMEI